MPKHVRNWWIETTIDGRKHKLAGGPRAKDGGFILRVFQRDKGSPVHVLDVRGHANVETGMLRLTVIDSLTHPVELIAGALAVQTERDGPKPQKDEVAASDKLLAEPSEPQPQGNVGSSGLVDSLGGSANALEEAGMMRG